MPNYKEMYLKLLRASEVAINILVAAQQECEELYLQAPPPITELTLLDGKPPK